MLAVYVVLAVVGAYGLKPMIAHASAMTNMNMNGSAVGMPVPETSTGTSIGPNIPISDITNLNTQSEVEMAVAMHDSTAGTVTSADMRGMTMSTSTPVAQGPLTSWIDFMGEGFWCVALILFVFVFSGCLYYLFLRNSATSHAPVRRRIAKWLVIVTLPLAVLSGVCLLILLRSSFAAECAGDGNEWGMMQPSVAGMPFSQESTEGCMWGMGNYMYMFPDQHEYDHYKDLGQAEVALATAPSALVAGVPTVLTVSLKNQDGTPATLFIDMDKVLHVIIVSKDETVFAHIHPDDIHPLTQQEIDTSTFTLDYTFPKSGDYLVAVDYAHGVSLESEQFPVHVSGGPPQSGTVTEYPTTGTFDGYDVTLKYPLPIAGQIETIVYNVTKDGKPVTFVPWLEAAMHVSIVKNDFSWYLHVHGEVHPPGQPLPPLIVKNGQVLHSMAMMTTPAQFSLPIEAHLIFPSPGLYTVWGQFKTKSGDLVATAFTVQVEQ